MPETEEPEATETDTETETDEGQNSEPEKQPAPRTKESDSSQDDEVAKWRTYARKHEKSTKMLASLGDVNDVRRKIAEYDKLTEQQKTEQQKLADELAAAKADGSKTATELLRLDVALEQAPEGMPVAKIRKLAKRLTGSSREELEDDAEDLFAEFQPKEPEPAKEPKENGGKPSTGRPTEALKQVPLAVGAAGDKTDMNDWMRRKRASE